MTTATHNTDADTAYRGKRRELAGLLGDLAHYAHKARRESLGILPGMVRGLDASAKMHDLVTFERRTWHHAAEMVGAAHRVRLAVDVLKRNPKPTPEDYTEAARLIGEAIDTFRDE